MYTLEQGLLDADSETYVVISDLQAHTMEAHREDDNQILRDYMKMQPHYCLARDHEDHAIAAVLFLPCENIEQCTSMKRLQVELDQRGLEFNQLFLPHGDVARKYRGQNLFAQMLAGSVDYAKSLGRTHLIGIFAQSPEMYKYGTTRVKNLIDIGFDGPDGRRIYLVSLDDLGLML